MKQFATAGWTDRTVLVFIPDAASTDGGGKTGLAHTSMTVSYIRVETDNDVTVTDSGGLTNLASLTAAHSDWGWEEVDSSYAPGLYRLDLADAVFASGAWSVVVYVMITSGEASASPMEFIFSDLTTAAEVNAQVVDALATDTYAEPGQGAPAATATLAAKINYLYKAWRNKKEQTATKWSLYDDAGSTVDQQSTVSDNGTTGSFGEIATGP
jgi:hypothetical protein